MHQELFTTTHLFTRDQAYRVHWLRFRVQDLFDRASHRRLRRKNAGFVVSVSQAGEIPADHEELYTRYRASITFEGAESVHHALFGDDPVRPSIFSTHCLTIHDGDRLVAAGYFDTGLRSGASILHFFDPDYRRYSLGKFMILLTIDFLREHGMDLYYPGYVVAGNPKMDYKLFLGRECAAYYDPAGPSWRPFSDSVLRAERLTEMDRLQVALAMLS